MWPEEVNKALATTVGILCVTQENRTAPWLLFEAGGLSKGLLEARVCPLLIDLQSQDVKQPLARFTFTLPNKEDMWKLLKTINHSDPEKELREDRLEKSFDRLWPEFEKPFQKIREGHKRETKLSPRSTDDMVIEILKVTRELQRNSEEILQTLLKREPGGLGGGYSGYTGLSAFTPPSLGEAYEKLVLMKNPGAATKSALEILTQLVDESKKKGSERKAPEEPFKSSSNKGSEKTSDKPHA
jgi:hypothetical protein